MNARAVWISKEIDTVLTRLLFLLTDLAGSAGVGCRLRGELLRIIGFKLGRQCRIAQGVYLRARYLPLTIGEGTQVNHGVIFDIGSAIDIGAWCNVGFGASLCTTGHELQSDLQGLRANVKTGPIRVEDFVWIGAKAIVLGGVTIGKGSVIGAGSVVTKSIPPNSLALGVPAKVVKTW